MDRIIRLLERIAACLDTPAHSPWLTLPQGAKYVQMDPQPFRELVYTEAIPSYQRSEKRIFVNTQDLDTYMRSLPSASRVPKALRKTA